MRMPSTYPVAYPFALLSNGGSYLQNDAFAARSGDDSMSLVRDSPRDHRRGRRATARYICAHLSEREIAVLRDVERFRFLTAVQVERLHFFDHASTITAARICRRVLSRLTKNKLLWRLDRRVGGLRAGSSSYVYGLAPLGYRALHPNEGKRLRRGDPSTVFIDHTLAVAQIAVDLQGIVRDGAIEALGIETEPLCWRRFGSGLEGGMVLKPDLYVALSTDEFDYRWFIEVDLATHSPTSAVRKCMLYQRYWASGNEQANNGLFPQVLLIAPTQRRADRLEHALDAAHTLKRELFAVTTTEKALARLCGGAS